MQLLTSMPNLGNELLTEPPSRPRTLCSCAPTRRSTNHAGHGRAAGRLGPSHQGPLQPVL